MHTNLSSSLDRHNEWMLPAAHLQRMFKGTNVALADKLSPCEYAASVRKVSNLGPHTGQDFPRHLKTWVTTAGAQAIV